ncbi:enoyl-CoA hydratase/isomerase family protein [Undibacterium sp.]|uniref:enoyl-CoA hydratase/isomerase family protein n=1 Tax=Undibacterium sp. TaxID=1914977 RepID=UPI002C4F6D55|nr:enoyl-CoA hydratase/isomerase family protein [Undibacterium sp.]HTD07043.1 enoyl-CoA hydratase/isomerase family protein [Undibacterium sp.]
MTEANLAAAAAPALFEELTAANGKRIGVATLNVEKTLNAISLEMVDLLDQQLRLWAADPQLAMVVLQAAGEKAFCAGGDLQGLYRTMLDQHAAGGPEDIRSNSYACDFFEREYRLDYLIHTYPKPILAWAHGIVMGGGIGLMAGASHRVVTEKSRLAMPEITIGLYPDVGGTWFLNRMPGQLGLFLALSGASIGAADAIFARLADYQINHAQKQSVLATLLSQPWDGQQDDVLLSRVLQNAERLGAEADAEAWAAAGTPLQQHFELINRLCSAPTLAEVVANIVELKTDDPWLQKGIATLAAGSPGSAWLSHALQKRARHMSLAEIFRLEYVVSLHCAARADFAEGIRALIIDKDRQPKWQPATLAAVDSKWGNGFFDDPWTAASHPLADLR